MPELLKRLDKIGRCLCCDTTRSKTTLDRDHFYPKCLYKQPDDIDPTRNPFKTVVVNRRNIYVLCRGCHESVDGKKIATLKKGQGLLVDPESLVMFLRQEYPVTQNPRYFAAQLKNMIDTHMNFARVAMGLNGEFSKELVRRYESAADLAIVSARALRTELFDFKQNGIINR